MIRKITTSNSVRNLSVLATTHIIEALLDQIPEDDQNTVFTVKQDTIPTSSATDRATASYQPTYDPTVAYILEFCTILALRNEELIQSIGRAVFGALLGLLRDPAKWHPITLSRATFHALSILKSSYVRFAFKIFPVTARS